MKRIFYLISTTLVLSACGASTTSGKETGPQNQEQASPEAMPDSSANAKQAKTDTVKKVVLAYPRNLFTELEAGGILGEAVHLKDSSYSMSIATKEYKCAYLGNKADPKSGGSPTINFTIQDYNDSTAAHAAYANVKTKNNNKAARDLKGVGNEGYMIVDGNKQWFIIIRKGKRMFRIEADKMNMTASIIQFTSVSKTITDRI